ncbi:hypothetical protein RJ55_02573 [Drechmeria coniospora]|nr:hypothetical protein RJ55_02573 [Drechmeria coniospora]
MTATAVLTMAKAAATPAPPPPPPPTSLPSDATPFCCPSCGSNLASARRRPEAAEDPLALARIRQLELQVRQLHHKASAAVQRWAEYEAELSRMRVAQKAAAGTSSLPSAVVSSSSTAPSPGMSPRPTRQLLAASSATPLPSPTRASFLQMAPVRLSALLYPRKPAPSPASTTTTEDLLEALMREQMLRREAENRLTATRKEVEELTAALFEQANEMVADERRARARLEERVGELERRDLAKRRRLETLEGAMGRIERSRHLLLEEE